MTLCSRREEVSNMSCEVCGERSRQAAPEGQRWGNGYTGEADTCVQGQISAPNCVCGKWCCAVKDSETETVRSQTQGERPVCRWTGVIFRGQGL